MYITPKLIPWVIQPLFVRHRRNMLVLHRCGQRRNYLSFLWNYAPTTTVTTTTTTRSCPPVTHPSCNPNGTNPNNNNSSSEDTSCNHHHHLDDDDDNERTNQLMSLQHAHPLGPWKAILEAVQLHHTKWNNHSLLGGTNPSSAYVYEQPQEEEDDDDDERQGPPPRHTPIQTIEDVSHKQQQLQQHHDPLHPPFRVLDLACGPRGQPGTNIAYALPLAAVLCTDFCPLVIAQVRTTATTTISTTTQRTSSFHSHTPTDVFNDTTTTNLASSDTHQDINAEASTIPTSAPATTTTTSSIPFDDSQVLLLPLPPPPNLTTAVHDMTDLSIYETNTLDVISCCYGYSLSTDLPHALQEAHRVLVPGGILIIATWERSALLRQGQEVVTWCSRGGSSGGSSSSTARDDPNYYTCPDDAFLVTPTWDYHHPNDNNNDKNEEDENKDNTTGIAASRMALSGPGEMEALLVTAGFTEPNAIVTSYGTYPFDLGTQSNIQFAMGTMLVREELETMGAFRPLGTTSGNDKGDGGLWRNLAEEAFWIHIAKYTDMVDGHMMLRDNTFKLTISTKALA